MKKEQGITLITLILYVILLTFVVAGVSVVTSAFYTNVNEFDKESEYAVSFAKFNMYFLNDIKSDEVEVESVGDNYIILSYITQTNTPDSSEDSGISISNQKRVYVEYSVQDGVLYREKVKICDNVKNISILSNGVDDTVRISLKIGTYENTTTYAIEKRIKAKENVDTSGGFIEI